LQPKRERLLRGPDIREAAHLAFAMALIRVSSPRVWASVARHMSALDSSRRRSRYRRFGERARAFFGPDFGDDDQEKLWRDIHAALHRRRFATVAEWRGRFEPDIRVEGADLVGDALRRGSGVILWIDNFINHQVVGKKGLHAAGIGGWHVSWTAHGFSASRLGKKYLNRIQIDAEKRYVDGRIEFDAGSALTATREIARILAANGIVRITNNAYIGRKFLLAPLSSGTALSIATTPLNLSLKLGAPLLPVATFEEHPLQRYRVVIAPPLDVKGDDEFRRAAAQYGNYLRPLIEQYPAQWRGWAGSVKPIQT
jgi:lauroyl/myristoyl acyltransferase